LECSASGGQALRVLVVDDDPIFRSLLVARLRRIAEEVVEAESGDAAWLLAREYQFGLAVVDFEMPGFDGIALLQCLRGHPRTRHMPIVMCTSRSDQQAMHDAIEAGASSYLTKPLNWALFERHVQHLLQLSRATWQAGACEERVVEMIARRDALVSGLTLTLRQNLAMAAMALRDNRSATDVMAAITATHAVIERFSADYASLSAAVDGSAAPNDAGLAKR
jgi:CheY-like chemotaxis protein